MIVNNENKIYYYLRLTIIAASAIYMLSFLYVAVTRIMYPFELEWMEGGSVEHVKRILAGQEIYVKPTLSFIPYIYTPLYYWVSACFAQIFGIGFFPLRLVSVLSSLACFFFIYIIVQKETKSKISGIASTGLFAATFIIGGAWFDLARVDSLFMALFLASVYLLRNKHKPGYYVLAALFATLSFMTKQQALMFTFPLIFYLFFTERKLSWYFTITHLLTTGLFCLIYSLATDGWFWFWNFVLPARHYWNMRVLLLFWTDDIFKPLSVSIIFLILFFYLTFKNKEIKQFWFYFTLFFGMTIASFLSRLHYGGYNNVLIPVYAVISILAVLGFNVAKNEIKLKYSNPQLLLIIVSLFLVSQFLTLSYNPRKNIPKHEDVAAGKEFIEHISKVNGEVYIPGHCYIAELAHKKSYAHLMLVFDLILSNTKPSAEMENEFREALKNHKFAEIYLNDWQFAHDNNFSGYYSYFNDYYEKSGNLFEKNDVFWMMTGFITRPEFIYLPKNEIK